jgi:HD-GYP domain-containing protein (c-di-GMP phosphodiesterase class II)/HAMP domain-containing protein
MQIGTSFFKSRIARRFFVLFIGCALLPLSLLFGYSYQKVENQLYEQSMLRLEKDCKVFGLSLMDRLVHMDNIINIYASYLSSGKTEIDTSNALHDQVESMFVGTGLYEAGAGFRILSGHIDLESVGLLDYLLHQNDKTAIYTGEKDSENRTVYLLVPFTVAGVQRILVAQPIPSFLWGIGVNSMLPSMTEMAVYDEKGQLITATQSFPGTALPAMTNRSSTRNYMRFEYKFEGETYLASGWSLFLQSRFNAQTWTIILSGTRSNMLGAMLAFKRTFPLIIVLAFWSILFLSLIFIRKTLTPLAVLQQGTKRIGNGDLDSRVKIDSGDEFEQLAENFNTMASQLNKQFHTLAFIDEIDRSILSSLDSSVIIPRSLRMISEFFSNQLIMLAKLMVGDLNRMQLTILKNSHRNDLNEENVLLSKDEHEMLFTGEPFRVLNRDTFLPQFLENRTASNSFLFLPLDTKNQYIGALIMDFSPSEGQNSTEQFSQARQLADQLGIALHNAALVSDLERLSIGTVEALARTVDAKSKWTAGHSERVAALAVKIGQAMNWANGRLDMLFRGGLLHDIGKIGIPMAVLDKPGKLNEEEYDTIKTHPTLSGKILEPIQVYRDILPMIMQHHERYDGKGYPDGLSGEHIDITARILSVADVYDALISQRPYREGWIKENVLSFMQENRGIMFDPEVVDIFLSIDI